MGILTRREGVKRSERRSNERFLNARLIDEFFAKETLFLFVRNRRSSCEISQISRRDALVDDVRAVTTRRAALVRDGSRRHASRRPRRGRGRGHRRGGFPGRAHRRDGIQAHVPWERFVQVRGGARRALAPGQGRRQRGDAGGGERGRWRGTRAVGPPVPALLQRHERAGTSPMSASEAEARARRDERADVSPNGPLVPFGFFTTERLCFFFTSAGVASTPRRSRLTNAADPPYTLYETLTVNR